MGRAQHGRFGSAFHSSSTSRENLLPQQPLPVTRKMIMVVGWEFGWSQSRASLPLQWGLSKDSLKTDLKVKVAQSCLTLCDPTDYTAHGILQARILECVAFPFSRGSSQPRDRALDSLGFLRTWWLDSKDEDPTDKNRHCPFLKA